MTGHIPRWLVNVFLAGFLAVLAIDGFHEIPLTAPLKEAIKLPLVVTGLWQGPWRLYAPDVDHVNLRLKAEIVFADDAIATWLSPDWPRMSVFGKFVRARHMNYLNQIVLAGNGLEREDLCAYLARTVQHPQGKLVPVVEVRLWIRGAVVPPVRDQVVPAGPYVAFDDWQQILPWRPGV